MELSLAGLSPVPGSPNTDVDVRTWEIVSGEHGSVSSCHGSGDDVHASMPNIHVEAGGQPLHPCMDTNSPIPPGITIKEELLDSKQCCPCCVKREGTDDLTSPTPCLVKTEGVPGTSRFPAQDPYPPVENKYSIKIEHAEQVSDLSSEVGGESAGVSGDNGIIVMIDDLDAQEAQPGDMIDVTGKRVTLALDWQVRTEVTPGGRRGMDGKRLNEESYPKPETKSPQTCQKQNISSSEKAVIFVTNLSPGKQLHRCNVCNSRFIEASHVEKHMLTHTACVQCKICKKPFSSSKRLALHVQISHHCRVCKKYFEDQSLLKSHHSEFHSTVKPRVPGPRKSHQKKPGHETASPPKPCKPKTVKCTVCEKTYLNLKHLKYHMLSHGTRHKCSLCTETIDNIGDLRRHQIMHDKEKKHVCSVCGKKCMSIQALHYHMTTHQVSDLLVDTKADSHQLVDFTND